MLEARTHSSRPLYATLPKSHSLLFPYFAPSRDLRITKIHLRMLLLEVLQHVELLTLVARRQTHLLLPLIEHHLLDHAPRLAVQVAQLAVLGLDLGRVEVVGRVGGDGGPPGHFAAFVEVDADFFGRARGRGFEGPGTFGGADFVREGTLWSRKGGDKF